MSEHPFLSKVNPESEVFSMHPSTESRLEIDRVKPLLPVETDNDHSLVPLPVLPHDEPFSCDTRTEPTEQRSPFDHFRVDVEQSVLPLIRQNRRAVDPDALRDQTVKREKLARRRQGILTQLTCQRRHVRNLNTHLTSNPDDPEVRQRLEVGLTITIPRLESELALVNERLAQIDQRAPRHEIGSTISRTLLTLLQQHRTQDRTSEGRAAAYRFVRGLLGSRLARNEYRVMLAGLNTELATIDLFERIGVAVEIASEEEDLQYKYDLKVDLNGLRDPYGRRAPLGSGTLLVQVKN